jgi:hypothetical protein
MLTHGNVSFILFTNQNNHMVVTNDNIHIISQKMKLYFVDFFFRSQSMSLQLWSHMTYPMWLMGF